MKAFMSPESFCFLPMIVRSPAVQVIDGEERIVEVAALIDVMALELCATASRSVDLNFLLCCAAQRCDSARKGVPSACRCPSACSAPGKVEICRDERLARMRPVRLSLSAMCRVPPNEKVIEAMAARASVTASLSLTMRAIKSTVMRYARRREVNGRQASNAAVISATASRLANTRARRVRHFLA
jgi:hypothetical protein